MNKTRFVVDSAHLLIIDPKYLETFAFQFSFQDFVEHCRKGSDAQEYINSVTTKAFPLARTQLVGLLEADGIYGDTEFVGDGTYEISSEAVRMTPEYKQAFLSWVAKEIA